MESLTQKLIRRGKGAAAAIPQFVPNIREFNLTTAWAILRRSFNLISVEKYIETISRYMEKDLQPIIEKYRAKSAHSQHFKQKVAIEGTPVFVCWFQGEDKMPDICKACVNRLRSLLTENQTLVFLTEEDIQVYVDIPEVIWEKFKSGVIGYAHFSDILRLALLSTYGGLWVDATVYMMNPKMLEMGNRDFHTCRFDTPDYKLNDASRGKWTGFLCGGIQNTLIFPYVLEAALDYWTRHSKAVDYLYIDYVIWSGYKIISKIRDAIDSVPLYKYDFNVLNSMFESRASDEAIAEIRANGAFFKINRHREYSCLTEHGEETIYAHILKINGVI